MIAGSPCFVGMCRKFDRNGDEISIEWLVFFDEDEGKQTLTVMVETSEADCIVALNPATMFLPDKAKAN